MRRGTAAGLLLTAVMLSGCIQEPGEGGTLPPLSSASPTPSASASPKPTGSDRDQIIALSKDYFAETNKALNSGDTERLRSLFTPECASCVDGAEYVERHWKNGSIRAPNYYRVSQVTGALLSSPNTGYVNVVFTTGQETRLDASGRTTKIIPPNSKPQAVSVGFERSDGIWRVSVVQKV